MKHRSLEAGEMGVALLLAFSAIAGAVTWAHSTPPATPETARSDSIAALEGRLQELRAEEEELRARADSLTDAYRGVPRWAR